MRIKEIMEQASAGASTAGAVAVVAQPLGEIQRRIPEQSRSTKYSNGPAKDYAAPRRKPNAR
jgi:uncharacterized protein YoaH (UPF0181 family)